MRAPAASVLGAFAISTSSMTPARADVIWYESQRSAPGPSYLVQLGLAIGDMRLDRFNAGSSSLQLAAGWVRGPSFVYGEVLAGVQFAEIGERSFSGPAGAASVRVR